MFNRINESFDRNYQPLEEVKTSDAEMLKKLLTATANSMLRMGNNNLKAFEIAFQEDIERFFPDKSWWEVTDCNIFMELFNTRDPFEVIDTIIAGLKESTNDDALDEEADEDELVDKLESIVSKLDEDEMSDEDKHDSELIRSMIQKIQARSNAAFTPEEKAVMDKYGINRNNWSKKLTVDGRELNPDLDDFSREYTYSRSYSNGTPSKINYADRARKLPVRKQNQIAGDGSASFYQNGFYNAHGGNRSIQDIERNIRNDRMREPVDSMTRALKNRRSAQRSIDGADAERERRMAAAQAAFDKAKKDADWWYENDTVQSARYRDRAQAEIDTLLKRDQNESKQMKRDYV